MVVLRVWQSRAVGNGPWEKNTTNQTLLATGIVYSVYLGMSCLSHVRNYCQATLKRFESKRKKPERKLNGLEVEWSGEVAMVLVGEEMCLDLFWPSIHQSYA
jgi:hypothetical protein